jgi:hypothetical protein
MREEKEATRAERAFDPAVGRIVIIIRHGGLVAT